MIKNEAKILISKNVETVWEQIKFDNYYFSNLPKIDNNFQTIEIINGELGKVGSKYKANLKYLNLEEEIEIEIIDLVIKDKQKKYTIIYEEDLDFIIQVEYEINFFGNNLTELKVEKITKDISGINVDIDYHTLNSQNQKLKTKLEKIKLILES